MTHDCKACGFTLIELSMVLVIIALVVGGVLVGRDLIYTAEMNQAIKQISMLNTQVLAFKLKYNCLPGDCANATDFFPAHSACNPTYVDPGDPYIPEGQICNGNGNGNIQLWEEQRLFWQTMNNLGFPKFRPIMHQNFVHGPTFPFNKPFTDRTMIAIAQDLVEYQLIGFPQAPDLPPNYMIAQGRWWVIGVQDYWATNAAIGVSAHDTRYIDMKIDDGKPYTGSVIGSVAGGGVSGCVTGDNTYLETDVFIPWIYQQTESTASGCAVFIKAPF